MEKPAGFTGCLIVVLLTLILFQYSNALAWGSSRYSSSYGSSDSSSSTGYSSTTSSWGSSGSSRDGSISWTSWSYSDIGSSTSETFCRKCHGDLNRFPILKHENLDKHHLLLNKTVQINSIAPNDTPGNLYECLTCHSVITGSSGFVLTVTRDCLKCHPINTVTGPPYRSNNVHHRTTTRNCNTCHSVIGF